MQIENELTVSEINKGEIINKLRELGAEESEEVLQKRYVYDFKPYSKNKWIRLRTNGSKTTLTVKDVSDENKISGTKELEFMVSDFDKANLFLEELGYKANRYEENKRKTFKLNGINFEIDTWPLIPTYLEIEADSEQKVKDALKLLNLNNPKISNEKVQTIYKKYYNIDLDDYKILKF